MTKATKFTAADMAVFFAALNKAFNRADSVNSSFLTDIFGVTRDQASFIVREWRSA